MQWFEDGSGWPRVVSFQGTRDGGSLADRRLACDWSFCHDGPISLAHLSDAIVTLCFSRYSPNAMLFA